MDRKQKQKYEMEKRLIQARDFRNIRPNPPNIQLSKNNHEHSSNISSNQQSFQVKGGNLLNQIKDVNFHASESDKSAKTKVKVIILTYMRSGSSFTGDVFNHHPDVFYVYEPLWSIQKNYAKSLYIPFLNRSAP